MAIEPYTPDYNALGIEIAINGDSNGLHTFLKKAEVHYELNKIPFAKLSFIASNPDVEGEDNLLESDTLAVNDEIEILVKEGDESKTLFKGIIFKMERNVEPSAGFETKIECKDVTVNLISQQEVIADETFEDKMNRFLNHLSIPNEVEFGAWAGEIVSKTSNVSPWDYLLGYLDAIGLMTNIKEGAFKVFDSTAEAPEPTYLAKNGVNVFEFEGRDEESVSNVVIQYWNPETQAVETQESDTNVDNGEGSEVIDLSQSNYTAETLAQMALSRAAKHRLASVKGQVKTFGNLEAHYGDYVSFEKVNTNIDGRPLIISLEKHTIENGCWNTEYSFGLGNNSSFTENIRSTSVRGEERIGQTNTVSGLQIGVVTKIEDDPENQFRIKVRIPAISPTGEGVWARMSSIQAGPDRGAFFIPEEDDEVVLGCFNNNPDTPVILGKLYSSAHAAPFPIEEGNPVQGLVSKEGTRIVINDDDKSIEISTMAGNKLLVSDSEKGFVLEDQNQNKLMLNDQGITLESNSDITLKAMGKVNIEGAESTLKASGNMTLNGALINLN